LSYDCMGGLKISITVFKTVECLTELLSQGEASACIGLRIHQNV
jgi:hypothetical protein